MVEHSGHMKWSGYETWFTSRGRSSDGRAPLVIAHGGPGMTHDYLVPLSRLAEEGRQVILYDQVGNGNSTRLPKMQGARDFWTTELFLEELMELVQFLGIDSGFHLLGQSWGGMLGIEYAVRQPAPLISLTLANSPSSMSTWAAELTALREALPANVRDVLDHCEAHGLTDSAEYAEATLFFYRKHLCRLDPWPSSMQRTYDLMMSDPTVYSTMIGSSEFNVTGSLRNWDLDDQLESIAVPTLVLHGEFDEATDEVVRASRERIRDVEYFKVSGASHTPHLEHPEVTREVISSFLSRNDP